MQSKPNRRPNFVAAPRQSRISFTAPFVGEGKYDDLHKLHRWLSDLGVKESDHWNQRLIKVGS